MRIGGNPHLNCCTWNAGALFAAAKKSKAARRNVLNRLMKFQVITLQETHGGDETMWTLFPEIAFHFEVFSSWDKQVNKGGVITLINKKVATNDRDHTRQDGKHRDGTTLTRQSPPYQPPIGDTTVPPQE